MKQAKFKLTKEKIALLKEIGHISEPIGKEQIVNDHRIVVNAATYQKCIEYHGKEKADTMVICSDYVEA